MNNTKKKYRSITKIVLFFVLIQKLKRTGEFLGAKQKQQYIPI